MFTELHFLGEVGSLLRKNPLSSSFGLLTAYSYRTADPLSSLTVSWSWSSLVEAKMLSVLLPPVMASKVYLLLISDFCYCQNLTEKVLCFHWVICSDWPIWITQDNLSVLESVTIFISAKSILLCNITY